MSSPKYPFPRVALQGLNSWEHQPQLLQRWGRKATSPVEEAESKSSDCRAIPVVWVAARDTHFFPAAPRFLRREWRE